MSRKCTHFGLQLSQSDLYYIYKSKQDHTCTDCMGNGRNLWICLYSNCMYIGCSKSIQDHSTKHFHLNNTHCVHMNLTTKRVWCHMCNAEVKILNKRRSSLISNDSTSDISRYSEKMLISGSAYGSSVGGCGGGGGGGGNGNPGGHDSYGDNSSGDEDDFERRSYYGGGLIGLQNIANTCYMNAALQALSNTPPLTRFFIECGDLIEATNDLLMMQQSSSQQRKTGLARSYHRLIKDMWCRTKRNNGYVVPSGILLGIRSVHPMFRGYQQHDTQEFLRCFMDLLHEELKELQPPPPEILLKPIGGGGGGGGGNRTNHRFHSMDNELYQNNNQTKNNCNKTDNLSPMDLDDDRSQCSSPSLSQSEAEYETCDSGMSEQSSLSDEMSIDNSKNEILTNKNKRFSRSPSPPSPPTSPVHYHNLSSATTAAVTYQRHKNSHQTLNRNTTNNTTTSTNNANNNDNHVLISNEVVSDNNTKELINNNNNNNNTTNNNNNNKFSDGNKGNKSNKNIQRSIISDVFDGKLLSSVQCLTCDRISTREETFQDLSLPIPGKDHLTLLHQGQVISSQQQQQPHLSSSSSSPPLLPVPPPQQNIGGGSGSGGGVTCTDAVYQVGQDGWFWWIWNWFRSFFWGPAVSLHDCLAAFFSADELKGDNMYSCEKCKKLRNGIKFSRVLELPEMLCVHLKRFRHDLSYSSKIASPVNFPLRGLDMSAYLHKECTSDVSIYDLTAVICHHGTVGGGHYTSFAKHEGNGKWYEYDDQLVTEVSEEMVQNCEAYVLFYRKCNPHMNIIRLEVNRLIDQYSMIEPIDSDIQFYVTKQWWNKLQTFAEPGPIDNWALLCPHGALPPQKAQIQSELVIELPQTLWEYLYEIFGGGPACNHLNECTQCRIKENELIRRKSMELSAFKQYSNEMSTTLYAISMSWLRQWQSFVDGGCDDDIPGPINNNSIVLDGNAKYKSVKPGSDYAQLTSGLWRYFFSVYAGGPEIIVSGPPEEFIVRESPATTTTTTAVNIHKSTPLSTVATVPVPASAPVPVCSVSQTIAGTNYDMIDHNFVVDDNITKNRNSLASDSDLEIKVTNKPLQEKQKPISQMVGNNNNNNTNRSTPQPHQSSTTSSSSVTSKQTTTTAMTTKKIIKNVSFEDDSETMDNSSVTSSTISSETKHPSVISAASGSGGDLLSNYNNQHSYNNYSKKTKHHLKQQHQQQTTPNDIISKKDKRHRGGITSNGLFGPEGKYSDINEYKKIPQSHSQTIQSSFSSPSIIPFQNDSAQSAKSISSTINHYQTPLITTTPGMTTKKLEEMLIQTTIGSVVGNVGNGGGGNGDGSGGTIINHYVQHPSTTTTTTTTSALSPNFNMTMNSDELLKITEPISISSGEIPSLSEPDTNSESFPHRKSHKSSYRKKLKTKSNRKSTITPPSSSITTTSFDQSDIGHPNHRHYHHHHHHHHNNNNSNNSSSSNNNNNTDALSNHNQQNHQQNHHQNNRYQNSNKDFSDSDRN